MIALQTQVQQLVDMVQRLQSTVDGRFGVLQHLVEQTADNANQMTATVNALQQKIKCADRSRRRQTGHRLRPGAVPERLGRRSEVAYRQAG